MGQNRLLVGLGNPGAAYRGTRHNLGFEVIDAVAARLGVVLDRTRHQGLVAEAQHAGRKLLLVKPQTFMNRSGDCVAPLARNFTPDRTDILVVVDDVALVTGRLRLRGAGSAGGHNGLKSLIERLGGQDFARLRMGVGEKGAGQDLAGHVLSRFRPEEKAAVEEMTARACDCALAWVEEGLEAAMNRFTSGS